MAPSGSRTADAVYTYDETGKIEILYYQVMDPFAGGEGWRRFGYSTGLDQKNFVVPAGRGMVIKRTEPSSFTWEPPLPDY